MRSLKHLVCVIEGCDRSHHSRGMCYSHYRRWRRTGDGWCDPHYRRWHKYGDKNGVRDDNRLENLELWSVSHPPGQRVEDKLKWALEMVERYA